MLTQLPKDVQTKYLQLFWLKIFSICHYSVIDTGGAPWAANISANFEKIWNDPKGILRGLGETDSGKKPEVENLVALSLSPCLAGWRRRQAQTKGLLGGGLPAVAAVRTVVRIEQHHGNKVVNGKSNTVSRKESRIPKPCQYLTRVYSIKGRIIKNPVISLS
jgi:hypothetical protein